MGLWDGARTFTIKASQIYRGHYPGQELSKQAAFMGKAAKDSKLDADLSRPDGQKKRPPLVGPAKAFGRCMADFSPRQLNVAFQVPLPGDSIWTEAFLDEWCERWPGFDRTPYDDARGSSGAGAH